MKHTTFTRFLSLSLAIAVMMSLAAPVGVYANDETLPSASTVVEQTTPPQEQLPVEQEQTPAEVPAEPSEEQPAETALPEAEPVVQPTAEPVVVPTVQPESTAQPVQTQQPEQEPAVQPTAEPVVEPTTQPESTAQPEQQATATPEVVAPTATPADETVVVPETLQPAATIEPTATVEPTAEPEATAEPTAEPFDVVAAYEYMLGVETEEDAIAYLDTLSEEEYAMLEEYANSVNESAEEELVSVPYLDAGPFLAPVFVPSPFDDRMDLLDKENGTLVDNEGIVTSKTVRENGENGYMLRLESYVTGKTTSSEVEKTIPVDVVLVLDQSGSMAFDFNGNETRVNENRRQYALKNSVNAFIKNVNKKYSAEADHRISIVTFGSNASTLVGWTDVNNAGMRTLQRKVSALLDKPEGATNTAAGVKKAEYLMGNGYSYNGKNTERQKVVIVFTDGAPTEHSEFDIGVANGAIGSARKLKSTGATVYTVGIFSGVNVNQLHGTDCDGSVGSTWKDQDSAACNRFMNYLSSNFENATEVGLRRKEWFISHEWKIIQNFERTNEGYYLAATNASELDNIFQQISDQIQNGTASVQLGSETVVKDVITPQFKLPDNASDQVKVYTADYQKDGSWTNDTEAQIKPVVDQVGKTVTVKGFDFSKNYCDNTQGRDENDVTKPGNFYGRKLIIEIPIEVELGFFGGNNISTNGKGSAIYDKDGKNMEDFVSPNLNLPIQYDFTTKDQTIYLTNSADLANAFAPADGFVADGKNNANVDIAYTVTDADGNVVGTYQILHGQAQGKWQGEAVKPNVCTEYSVSCQVAPIGNSADSLNAPAVEAKALDPKPAMVHVLKPTVTWHDSTRTYGALITASLLQEHQAGDVTWADSSTHMSIPDATGVKPTLNFTFTDEQDAEIVDTKLQKETLVKVIVWANGQDITESTVQNWTTDSDCSCTNAPENAQFRIHLPAGSLVIVKHLSSFNSSMGDDASFTFKIEDTNGNIWYRHVTLTAAGDAHTKPLNNLPAGQYTVTELSSLGYKSVGETKKVVEVSGVDTQVQFTNDSTGGNVPGDQSIVRNCFTWDATQSKWVYTAS